MHKYLLQSFLFASPLLPAVKIGTNESSISCLFLPPLSLFLPLPLTLFQKKEGVPNGGEEEEEEGFFLETFWWSEEVRTSTVESRRNNAVGVSRKKKASLSEICR